MSYMNIVMMRHYKLKKNIIKIEIINNIKIKTILFINE
jgi:hypothetical protein